tara:strand:+ start:7068 stop:7571 length:504 start_codon:yes stop_codon:yes gene_type:complete
MIDTGPRAFYVAADKIKNQLLEDPNVNTVTTGDITEIDLNKITIFPLAHIIFNSAALQGNVISFSISVLAMDLVQQTKDEFSSNVFPEQNSLDKTFVGLDNEHDVLNTQLAVVNRLNEELRRGQLYTDLFQLEGAATCEPFFDRFENKVAGWTYTFNLLVQNDISKC